MAKTRTTTRTTEITVERDEVRTIKQVDRRKAWCEKCARESLMVTLEEALALAGVGKRTLIERLVNHGIQPKSATDRLVLVCENSINDHTG